MSKIDPAELRIKQQDLLNRSSGFGGRNSATFTLLNGLNNQGGIPAVPPNTDSQGFTFFTKPCLNLSYHNVRTVRSMNYLTNKDKRSVGNAIRCMLSPPDYGDEQGDKSRSDIVDDSNAFIPVLGNTLLSLTGWPDTAPTVYTSTPGKTGEQVAWLDDNTGNRTAYDLQASFANMDGNLILKLFKTWIDYGTSVAEGTMIPFPRNQVENRVDYQTRIYRLVMDKSKRYVQRIGACGASFPWGFPDGANLNFTAGSPLTEENKQISIPFKCLGAMYDDPILIYEFNKTVIINNPDMADAPRVKGYIKLDDPKSDKKDNVTNERQLFNYKSYPRIADDLELEWWVSKEVYDEMYETIGKIS